MKNERNKFSDEELVGKEPPITAKNLLREIFPILQDYFTGDLSLKDSGISYSLPNGQRFIITAYASE